MITGHSEFGKLKSVWIKRSKESFVDEKTIDREWKALNYLSKPDLDKATSEYESFESILRESGTTIHHFSVDSTVSMDSIYCRDASIATDQGFILCRMGKAARIAEPEAQRKVYSKLGMPVLGQIEPPGTIEGGDVAWIDTKTLAVGHTYRTNESGIQQLSELLRPLGVNVVPVELPHYKGPGDVFHLMSIFSPVDQNLAVVYSPLMPIRFRKELLSIGYEFIEVPDAEFDSMGCNVLALAPRHLLMVKGNPRTREALEQARCRVIEYEGSEISLKGGGGPTCLTRPQEREL